MPLGTRRRLLADIAHELRTPLATLEGYIEGLDDGVVAAEPATWQTLADALGRLCRLVDDVAVVSHAEEHPPDLELRQVSPAELIRQAVGATQPLAQRRGVRLHSDVTGRPAAVLVDLDRIGEALHNLLDNATRHTAHGGDVTVTTRRRWVGRARRGRRRRGHRRRRPAARVRAVLPGRRGPR
ncbi:MAG: hypothetical protein KY460_16645 [Actinobacteria bacterium]|nr:hypothetical protein [Actinomycetota bacterium]